jgi:DeoR/GlpR family transcriptional regulator of sugar metabolism
MHKSDVVDVVNDVVNEMQKKITDLIKRNSSITIPQMAQLLDVTPR